MAKKKKCCKELKLENLLVLNIVIFAVIAIMHFLRFILGTQIYIGNFELPVWLSGAAVLILVFLIWQNWIKTEKTKKTCAKILMGIFAVDLIGVLGFWYYDIVWFGISGMMYLYIAIFDALIVAGLFWYIKKK